MTSSPLSLVETLCEQAEEKLSGDDADGAEALASEALARDPGSNRAHQSMARAALLRGDRERARTLLDRWRDLPVDAHFGAWGALAEDLEDAQSARAIYEAHLMQQPEDPSSLFNLAMLCADGNERGLAQTLLQKLVRAAPRHAEGIIELARLYEDDDMAGLADELYARALSLDPDHAGAQTARRMLQARLSETARLPETELKPDAAQRLFALFAGRTDVYARQWVDGDGKAGYMPVREPLTETVLQAHIRGDQTIGVYLLRADGTVPFLAFDLDIRKPALEKAGENPALMDALRKQVLKDARRICAGFAALNLPVAVEDSGHKGCHIYLFFAGPMRAAHVRKFALAFVKRFGPPSDDVQWEIFPKQDAVAEGELGNLIKLPLGIHKKTGRRGLFIDPEGRAMADQTAVLNSIRPIDMAAFREAVTRLTGRETGAPAPVQRPDVDAQFPEFQPLLTGCAVARALIDKAFATRHLTHDERHVLKCVFGHLGERGQAFMHAVIGACADYNRDTTQYHLNQVRPSPIGCPRIRRYLPDLTQTAPCCCEFKLPENGYPSPVLHIDGAFTTNMSRIEKSDDRKTVERYVELRRQAAQVMAELAQSEKAVGELLDRREGRLTAGEWALERDAAGRIKIILSEFEK